MNKLLLLITLLAFHSLYAQNIPNNEDIKQLRQIESAIKPWGDSMIRAEEWIDRFRADSIFTKGLVRALRVPFSFRYTFDSINTISKLYAPDSSFRIFTWQIMKDFSYYRQKGAIQMHTEDGSLKLFPLFDFSDFTKAPNDSVRDAQHWIGAIYYRIILKTFNNKKYYTLLGSDENNERSNKKWIEILTFDESGNPQFGGRCFNYPANDPVKPRQPVYRFCLEYKKDGGVRMNYDPKYDAIIFDHLVSENEDPRNAASLIPYGSYEGFKWAQGQWNFITNPFANTIFDEKQRLAPAPLFDDKGTLNEKKLSELSKKSQQKQPANDNPEKIDDQKKQYQPGEITDY
jgi:hypothetical protein